MRAIAQTEIASALPGLLREVEKESVAIESDGRQVAYLVSPREHATTREAETKRLLEATAALQDEIAKNVREKGLDLDELMRDLDRKRA
jgi:antitoxin (DNA-binding transcriptional repressor) of toxin-antitoxin stability system